MEVKAKREPERVKLTKRLIDTTNPPGVGQTFLRDNALHGFGLRITPGARTFVLERRIHGRTRRISIGPYGPLTLDTARERAEQMIGQIADGKDPAQERLDRKREPLFGDLLEMYRERHLPRKKSAHNDKLMIDSYLAEWKNRKLSSISRKDVATMHVNVGEHNGKYAANRLIALFKKMFNLAKAWGLHNGENPAAGIEMFAEVKRDRFVHPEELPRLMESLKLEPNLYIRGAFFVCLLTGQRKSEVLGMMWEDVNLNQGIWRIPKTKAGHPHVVPLPGPVGLLLQNLPHVSENPFVFVGRGNSHLTNISKAWSRIRTRAELQDVRIHDLRRTLGSWLAGSGASLPLIGKVLNHSQPSTTAVYARLDLEPVRRVLEANAARMMLVAGQTTESGNNPESQLTP